jgi:hypothetical protein
MDLGTVIEIQHQNGTPVEPGLPCRASVPQERRDPFGHALVLDEHVFLVGSDHDVDQHQHFVSAVVRQRALHTDGADVLTKRRQAGRAWRRAPYHWDRSCDLRLFHESRKRVLTAREQNTQRSE